jgi:hypothetical protein
MAQRDFPTAPAARAARVNRLRFCLGSTEGKRRSRERDESPKAREGTKAHDWDPRPKEHLMLSGTMDYMLAGIMRIKKEQAGIAGHVPPK